MDWTTLPKVTLQWGRAQMSAEGLQRVGFSLSSMACFNGTALN
jgi:hypothetical protein